MNIHILAILSMSEPDTLRSKYNRGLLAKQQLTTLVPSSADYGPTLHSTTQLLHESQRLTEAAGIFSPNETVEDIATEDITYLSIDYHLAELASNSSTTASGPLDPSQRLKALNEAENKYDAFLTRLDQYDLLNRHDSQTLERWHSDRTGFKLLAAAGADATARRAQKIARYQAEKQLKQTIKVRVLLSQTQNQFIPANGFRLSKVRGPQTTLQQRKGSASWLSQISACKSTSPLTRLT